MQPFSKPAESDKTTLTPRGKKLQDCFNSHAKATGLQVLNPDSGEVSTELAENMKITQHIADRFKDDDSVQVSFTDTASSWVQFILSICLSTYQSAR